MSVDLNELKLPDELPAIPDGWHYESIGELVENRGVSYGIVQPGSKTSDGVPIVRVNNIRNGRIDTTDMLKVGADIEAKFQRSRLRGGEVLLTLVGTLGEVAVVPDSLRGWNVARAVGVIPVRKDPGSLWVSICLRSAFIQHCIRTWATTTVQATFNLRDLAKLPIPIPPADTRESIAAVLGALDDKIELNRRMNATLEAMARALFQSWFVDFDPVRAKLDGRQPVGLDPGTAALFPSHFDHKAEGVVPTGWNLKRWGDIATLEYGKSIRDYRESSGRYRVFGTNGPVGFHDEALCNCAGIVIGRKGAYRGVHYSPEPFFVIDTAFYLKPRAALDLMWAYYELLRFDINSMDSGSAIPSTSRDDFYGIPVIVPPPEIQSAFGKIVEGWFAKVFANNYESRTLVTLRDTLLPKLLSGELSVAEKH